MPKIETSAVTDVTINSFSCGGHNIQSFGQTLLECGIRYSYNQNGTAQEKVVKANDVNESDSSFIIKINDLQDGMNYEVAAFIRTIAGYYEAASVSVTTLSLAKLAAPVIDDISQTQAVAHCSITNEGSSPVELKGVCWSTHSNPFLTDNVIEAEGADKFDVTIKGLESNKAYYCRAFATSKDGTAYSEIAKFRTLVSVTTQDATNIIATGATLRGIVSSTESITEKGFYYGLTTEAKASWTKIKTTGSTFETNINNLKPNTSYSYYAYAINEGGMAFGDDKSFTTLNQTTPIVSTAGITNISYTKATCSGEVKSDGGITVTERGICYSKSSIPTVSDSKVKSGSGTGSYACNLSGLESGTTYYIYAYATNSLGTSYGEVKSFRTLSITTPSVSTASVTNITYSTATCGGNVSSDGGGNVTERGICYSKSSNPTISDSKLKIGSGTGSFTCNMSGLESSTAYYIRAYAINSVGTSYGEIRSFTTKANTNPTKTVTITGSNCGWSTEGSAQSSTIQGVTMSITQGAKGTESSNTTIRIYKYQTLTLSVSQGKILKVVFTCKASDTEKYGPGCFNSQSGYTYSGYTGTWSGNASSVSFTAETNQVRATQIVVTIQN